MQRQMAAVDGALAFTMMTVLTRPHALRVTSSMPLKELRVTTPAGPSPPVYLYRLKFSTSIAIQSSPRLALFHLYEYVSVGKCFADRDHV